MTTQQIEQTLVGGRRMVGGWMIGFALVALLMLLMVGWLTGPASARQAAAASQPVVGRAVTVTGLVFDGTRYISALIAIGASVDQPIAGRAITVMVCRGRSCL